MSDYDDIVNDAIDEIQFENPENVGTDGRVGVGADLGSRSQIDRDGDGIDDYVELALLNRFGERRWGSIPDQTFEGPPGEGTDRPVMIYEGSEVKWIDFNNDNTDDRVQQGTDFSPASVNVTDAAKSALPGWLRSQLFPPENNDPPTPSSPNDTTTSGLPSLGILAGGALLLAMAAAAIGGD